MIAASGGQRNPYKGDPPRPWIRVRFLALDGSTVELDLLADTGNPFAVIISLAHLLQLRDGDIADVHTNFGPLIGGWLEASIPELGFHERIGGYGSNAVIASAQVSSPDFGGLAGLPLLRMMRYGGDADFFWVESLSAGTVPK